MGDKLTVYPFKKEDIEGFRHLALLTGINDTVLEAQEKTGFVFTAKNDDGKVVAVAGVTPIWTGVGEGFIMFAPNIKKYFLQIHKLVKSYLKKTEFVRIQITVVHDFDAGHRWADLLGFRLEAERLSRYFINGKDATMYARVRE